MQLVVEVRERQERPFAAKMSMGELVLGLVVAGASMLAMAAQRRMGRKAHFHLGCTMVGAVVVVRNMAEAGEVSEYTHWGSVSATEWVAEEVPGRTIVEVAETRCELRESH